MPTPTWDDILEWVELLSDEFDWIIEWKDRVVNEETIWIDGEWYEVLTYVREWIFTPLPEE